PSRMAHVQVRSRRVLALGAIVVACAACRALAPFEDFAGNTQDASAIVDAETDAPPPVGTDASDSSVADADDCANPVRGPRSVLLYGGDLGPDAPNSDDV